MKTVQLHLDTEANFFLRESFNTLRTTVLF